MAERLRIHRFNSAAEFQAWWSGPEVKGFLKRHPDKLEALSEHPWVKPHLGEIKTPPVPDKNQDKSARQFGKYQIEKKLGQGGMGAVYLAYDPSLERRVALKVMILKEEDAVQRFMVEAKASARLKHSNILPVYEIGTVGKYHYFTMEYIDGVPLSDLIQDKSKRLNTPQIAGVIKDISSALFYAHSQGVLHRDIKPANIMIDKKGTPYLTDFGLAKEMSRIDRSLTISGTIVGTPDYMSPEQARGLKDRIMPTSDIFSLGATLYHCLTGHLPFSGNELYQVLDQIVRQEPVPPSRLVRNLDKDIETICLKCMEKEPDKRYRTARELQDELTRYLQREPIQAKPISIIARVLRKSKQNKIASVSLISVALIITGMLGYLITSKAAMARQIKEYHSEIQKELEAGNYDNAMVKLRTILNMDPADRPAHDLLRETIAKKNQDDERKSVIQAQAERLANEKTRRKEAEAILSQARTGGAPENRISIAREALKKDPSYEEANKLTGDAYREMKNYGQALEFYLKTSLPDKAVELGRKFARITINDPMNPSKTSELLEMSQLMADLGVLVLSEEATQPCLLGRPDLRLFCTNIMVGMFDGLGQPMTQEQVSRYKAQVDSMSEAIESVVLGDRNPIEQIIAGLQNQGLLDSEQRKLADIITDEQKVFYHGKTGEKFTGALYIPFMPSASYQGYNFKQRDQAVNFIIGEWTSALKSKPSELKTVIGPVAEKYISDYIGLRKTKESIYDKDIMDNYLERNKPDKTNKMEWMEYYKKCYGFRKKPYYIKAERVLNIEFLLLLDKYHKEAAKLISREDGVRLINIEPKISHFPDLD